MAEVVGWLLGALVVASLLAILVYSLVFLAAAAWTALASRKRDALADELDAFLTALLGPRTPAGRA